MIPDSLDFILRPTNDEQAEYAAAHQLPAAPSPAAGRNSEGAVRKGSQAASSGPTPAAGLVAGPPTTAPRPQVSTKGSEIVASHWRNSEWAAVPMIPAATAKPEWMPVAESTGDLLDLIAEQNPATPTEADEWNHFKAVLAEVAQATGLIDQNAVRPLLRGEIKPQRIGAFYNRAAKTGLIRASLDHTISNDKHGRNTGKPARVWRWIGTTTELGT